MCFAGLLKLSPILRGIPAVLSDLDSDASVSDPHFKPAGQTSSESDSDGEYKETSRSRRQVG